MAGTKVQAIPYMEGSPTRTKFSTLHISMGCKSGMLSSEQKRFTTIEKKPVKYMEGMVPSSTVSTSYLRITQTLKLQSLFSVCQICFHSDLPSHSQLFVLLSSKSSMDPSQERSPSSSSTGKSNRLSARMGSKPNRLLSS